VANPQKRRWVFPTLASVLVLLGVMGAGAGVVGLKYLQIQAMSGQGPPPEMPTSVTVTVSKLVGYRQSLTAIGTVVAPRSVTLSNEVPGTVTRALLSAGSIVESGTVLLQLDTSIEQAQLESAEAMAKMSRSRFVRTKQAFKTNALTELELEEAEGLLSQSEARVSELKAVIAKKTITAPFKGRLGLSDTHEGQYLPSGTLITSLQSVDDYLFVDFMLPQNVAHTIAVGQAVHVLADEKSLPASIEALDSRSDKLTRNLMVRARLSLGPEFLKPGDSLKVKIEFGPELVATGIPSEAVRRTPSGTQAFVAYTDEHGKLRAEQRSIQVAQTLGDSVALSNGINPGEKVVTAGSFKLMPGALIQVGGE
jgi:membrane fusion protein, multidrug efflux system